MLQGLKAAKDAYKRKNTNIVGGNTGKKLGAPSSSASQNRQHENSSRGKGQKHSGHQNVAKFLGPSGKQQNSWGASRSESSLWLLLINKLLKKSLLPVGAVDAFLRNLWFFLIKSFIHSYIRHYS